SSWSSRSRMSRNTVRNTGAASGRQSLRATAAATRALVGVDRVELCGVLVERLDARQRAAIAQQTFGLAGEPLEPQGEVGRVAGPEALAVDAVGHGLGEAAEAAREDRDPGREGLEHDEGRVLVPARRHDEQVGRREHRTELAAAEGAAESDARIPAGAL